MSKHICTVRSFLNPPTSHDKGFFEFCLTQEKSYWDTDTFHYEGTLTLADCDRRISLTIGFYNKKEKKQRIKKIQKLIDGLQKMQDAIEECEI